MPLLTHLSKETYKITDLAMTHAFIIKIVF